jgi:pimeloyl-ACP methyl ester carboxylesterase
MHMKTGTMWIAAAALLGGALHAQDIAGVWQGTITDGGNPYRTVLKIAKADGGWRGVCYSLDEDTGPVTATSVVFKEGNLTVAFPPHSLAIGVATYEGKLGPDHRSFAGTWIQPDGRYPLNLRLVTAKETWALPPAHTIRFVAVDPDVKLEVLDWGGSGRPLVFLSGLGATAHDFAWFAPKFTAEHHVYGITRRGFGASSSPPYTTANYAADRLGNDVLAVIDSLGLRRPVLVGHSIAGEELSSIGSRYPGKVAGLIYLDAGYAYALYDSSRGDFQIDGQDLLRALEQLQPGKLAGPDLRTLMHGLRDSLLPRFERDVEQRVKVVDAMPSSMLNAQAADTTPSAMRSIIDAEQKYSNMSVPILAIFALPHRVQPIPGVDSAARALMQAQFDSFTAVQATAFEKGEPSAHVVRIPNATHFVYRSNEADVLREMKAFLAALPQ